MSAKRIHRQTKPDTTNNASDLDDIIRKQLQREKHLISVRVNRTTTVLINNKNN